MSADRENNPNQNERQKANPDREVGRDAQDKTTNSAGKDVKGGGTASGYGYGSEEGDLGNQAGTKSGSGSDGDNGRQDNKTG